MEKQFSFCNDSILSMAREFFSGSPLSFDSHYTVLPGFCDVHVHFRQPGFSYKETIKTGSLAAARGGYTAVCTMPNLNPVPDSVEHLKMQTDLIQTDAAISVYPYAAITVGQMGKELASLENLTDAIAFSDDGRGVQSDSMMRSAMEKARSLGKMIVAHCEVNDLLHGGYIHDGEYAKANGHKGICSESEYLQIARDLQLVKEIGCKYHVCHISTKESVDLIRKAKAEGLNVTCETGPHYLVMNDSMLKEEGRFKMNPPIRSEKDREALLAGLIDGTVDMVATDHAPHSEDEKNRGLAKSAFGVVGLETAFPVLYTDLVKTGIMDMQTLLVRMSEAPSKRFGIPIEGFSVWNLEESYPVDPADFVSMGKATPFAGKTVYGKNLMTVYNGKVVYECK
jgi:dihydroorotase